MTIDYNKKEIESFFKTKKIFFAAWSCESKFYSGMAGWYHPLKRFFKEIIVFDPQKYIFLEGKDKMNEHFLNILKKEQPDYILMHGDAESLYMETLFKIKKISPNSKIIDFHGDDDTNFESHSRYISLISDYNLVFQKDYVKEYKKNNIENVFFTCATKIDDFKKLNLEKKYDLTFVGTARQDRYALIKFLKENNINVRLFGTGWEKYPDIKEIYLGQPNNTEMARIFNESKINLCFSKNFLGRLHLKGRIFEIGACGSFAVSEYYKTLGTIFKSKKEIVMFRTKEELLNKTKYYLENDNEREKIAEAMYKKINKKYNIYSELSGLLKKVHEQRNIPAKSLPIIEKKVITLFEDDFKKEEFFIKNKVREYDYIAFRKGESIFSKTKDYLQSYSLIISKKSISCCDYSVCSRRIGAYLRSYLFFDFTKENFSPLLNINQIMVTKKFFLSNISEFYKIFHGGKIRFLNNRNTSFVSIPLVSIYNLKIDPNLIGRSLYIEIDHNFSSLIYEKRIFLDKYLYNFMIESLFFGKFFLLKDVIKRRFNMNKMKTIRRLIELKNNSLYLDWEN